MKQFTDHDKISMENMVKTINELNNCILPLGLTYHTGAFNEYAMFKTAKNYYIVSDINQAMAYLIGIIHAIR